MTSMEISSSSDSGSSGSSSGSSSDSGARSSGKASVSGTSGSATTVGTIRADGELDDASQGSGSNAGDGNVDGAVDIIDAVPLNERPADYDSGEEAESGSDMEVHDLGIPMDMERHICPIRSALDHDQVLSRVALNKIRTFFPPPFVWSVRGAEHVMRRRLGMIMLHLDSVEAGLRFPLHSFYVEFFHCFQVAPAQFMPNSYRFISAFLVHCKLAGATATLDLFHYFYRSTPQNSDGYLSVAARPGRRLFMSYPSSIHDWKNRFFFLRYDGPPLPVRWNGYPPKIESPELTDDLSGDVEKLLQGGICPIAGYLTFEALSGAGIGSPPDEAQMNHAECLKTRKAKAAAAKAALAKAKNAPASDSNSSASDAARRTVEGEQHLIATMLAQGSGGPALEAALPPPVVSTKAASQKGIEKAPEKKQKRGRGAASTGPLLEDAGSLPLSRPAEELWREIALKAGLELPPRSSSEATSAALAAALQSGLLVLQAEAAREAGLKEAKVKADAALSQAREAARRAEAEATAKEKELAALRAESRSQLAGLEGAGFKLVPVLPVEKDANPDWLVDTSGYKNTGEFMDSARDYCAGAFGDVFSAALVKIPPRQRLACGVRILESSPLSHKFLYEVGDNTFAAGYNEGVKATLPIFAKLQGADFDLAANTDDDLLIQALGKLGRDRCREEAKARGEIPEPPTPEPEVEEEELNQGGSRPGSPFLV
ncbi:unnamed protein product [Cuscuta epithymum]|uniref:Transposase (putative) gypsy type domain-containing protein n=1 Tax=Cuscuta epithymum TaxID=186058 RepID=A0AAV0CJQ3_9ASTE|nr:unnamed protein product [Cuscuta epithymum]